MRSFFLRQTIFWGILFFILLSFSRFGSADDLEKIQKAIKEKSAKWEAGETSVSGLNDHEKKRLLGAIFTDETAKESAILTGVLPEKFDWRRVNSKNWVTSVKSQGSCGSCWAFAPVAAMESLELIVRNMPDPPGSADLIDLSEQYLVSCSRKNSGCSGGYLYVTYKFLQKEGAPDEACFPYQAQDLPCEDRCPDWEDRIVKISSWSKIHQDVNSLKAAVYECPVPVGFIVYKDFFYYKKGVYKHVWGEYMGGHGGCIVGWDDENSCFAVKNSWSTGWGESGFFNIAYDQVISEVYFGLNAGKLEKKSLTAPPRQIFTITTLWGSIRSE